MSKNAITTGLAVFVILALFPFWINLAGTDAAPDPKLLGQAKKQDKCVLDKYDMRAEHMSLLDQWRDSVVRDGDRLYTNKKGKEFDMSLSTGEQSCLGCHEDKSKFCNECHNYASVDPYCWDCHTDPKEIQ